MDELLGQIVASLQDSPNLVLEAPPGAGKTTRVPPALLRHRADQVLVLEPRRIAARMAARRVAEEGGEPVGETVGYQVRFEQVAGPQTRLLFMTEGVLTRRILADPELKGVGAVVLDEFHERHLETDLALALLRRLQRTTRPDLRLVVMSATLDGAKVAEALGGCRVLTSTGRLFPIDISYTPESAAPVEERVASAVERLLSLAPAGDILVFLPGAAEIRRAQRACEPAARRGDVLILPLHGDLSPAEQDRAVLPCGQRRVILSTNVAESSITIDGVRAVVDTGLARLARHSAWTGLPRVEMSRISRAAAAQRAGRAGRTGPGRVVRLYTEADLLSRAEAEAPEILRTDLAQLCLDLHAAGMSDPSLLSWLDPPPMDRWREAAALLLRLGALDGKGRLSQRGRRMARLPLHPRLAAFCVAADERGAGSAACAAAALLAAGERLPEQPDHEADSDLDILLERTPEARTRQLERQLARLLRPAPAAGSPAGRERILRQAALIAFHDRLAVRRKDRELRLAGGAAAQQARNSMVLKAALLVPLEIEERPDSGPPLVRLASAVEPEWLLDLYPDRMHDEQRLDWDRERERVVARSALLFDDLVIEESPLVRPDPAAATALLAGKAAECGVQRFADQDAVSQLLERLAFASAHGAAKAAPDELVIRALRRCAAGLESFAELERACRGGGLEAAILIEAGIRADELDRMAPARIQLPGGRMARVTYKSGQTPWVSSRLQDFFGMRETPCVACGRVPLVVHLLAPNQRPVQMTQDLAGFWERLYPQVRKELMRRYPRHAWPENPLRPPS